MKLTAHGWSLDLLPSLGGAIGALSRDGHAVLRAAPPGTSDVLTTGCFPLVPYANRIAHGHFAFDGGDVRLPRNFGDHPHSLHGLGWQRPWTVAEAGADHARLTHEHDGSEGWPWRYHATQCFELTADTMRVELTLTNSGDRAMPAGLGLHPYFPIALDTQLAFDAGQVWLADATMLPTAPAPADYFGDWSRGRTVTGDTLIDNAYAGWTGPGVITQPWGSVALCADGADVLHFYRPPGEPFFCIEPVSHLPDAANRGGIARLEPGDTRTLTMTLTLQ